MNNANERRHPSLPWLNREQEPDELSIQHHKKMQMNETPSCASGNPSRTASRRNSLISQMLSFDIDLELGERPTLSGDTDISDAEIQRILGTGGPGIGAGPQGRRPSERCNGQGVQEEEAVDESFDENDRSYKVSPIEEYRHASLLDSNLDSIDGSSLALIAAAAATAAYSSHEGPSASKTTCTSLDEHRQVGDTGLEARLPTAQSLKIAYDESHILRSEDDAAREQMPSNGGYGYAEYIDEEYPQQYVSSYQQNPPYGYNAYAVQTPKEGEGRSMPLRHCTDHEYNERRYEYICSERRPSHSMTFPPQTQSVPAAEDDHATENEREQEKWREIIEQNKTSIRRRNKSNTMLLVPKGDNLPLPLVPATTSSATSAHSATGTRSTNGGGTKRTRRVRNKHKIHGGGGSRTKDPRRGKRGSYKCRLCGQPKANHDCQALQEPFGEMQEQVGTQTTDRGGKISLYSGVAVLDVRTRDINDNVDVGMKLVVEEVSDGGQIDIDTTGLRLSDDVIAVASV